VTTRVGAPVGVRKGAVYSEVDVTFPRGSTLLLYTDGAIERRGERLDVGLQRLAEASAGSHGSLDEFLTTIAQGAIPADADDDTALLAIRWPI